MRDTHCTSELHSDSVAEKTRDVGGCTRQLGLEYSGEEKLHDALESFKGSVEQARVQTERSTQPRGRALRAVPARQAGLLSLSELKPSVVDHKVLQSYYSTYVTFSLLQQVQV